MGISIIIKTLNEEKRIENTIQSALKAVAPFGGEVIVADSGSSDRTIKIAEQHPVVIAQIKPPAKASCGIGPQLGYQYAQEDFICLIDGDMLLDPSFLESGIKFLNDNPQMAGVTGHIQEMLMENMEFERRVKRNSPENQTGPIDRMNGGGLYRRSAIQSIGHFSDRNLHGYEEFEVAIRLRNAGWELYRLDQTFVQHFGHTINSYKLLLRRWQSKYLRGIGELLRSGLGKSYFLQIIKELPEIRLWFAVLGWWLVSLLFFIIMPQKLIAAGLILLSIIAAITLMSIKKRSLSMGFYTVTAWFFHAAALPIGFCAPRQNPSIEIESTIKRPGS